MSFKDRIGNNLLLLYTIKKTNEIGLIDDTLKLQKIVFHSQRRLSAKKLKAFSYNFFRWEKGPFSADLNNDLTLLIHAGLIKPGWPIELTDEGYKLLESCIEIFDSNKRLIKNIDEVVEEKAKQDPNLIKEETYDLTVTLPRTHKRMTIREIPKGTPILFRISDAKAERIFDLNEQWLSTLEVAFHQEIGESLVKSCEDASEGKAHDFRTIPAS
jgi:uncharacterized protein YwgA